MLGNFLRSGRTTRRMTWAVLAVAAAVLGQTPAREYIRLGGRVIAIESPAPATTRYTLTLATAGAAGVTASFTTRSPSEYYGRAALESLPKASPGVARIFDGLAVSGVKEAKIAPGAF